MKSPFEGKSDIRRYSILPARAMQDESLHAGHYRVMACLGMYTNSYGICWPAQETIARHIGYNRTSVTRIIKSLIGKGYIRKLEFKDYPPEVRRRSWKRVNRYQVLWEGNDQLPSREQFWAPQPKLRQDSDDLTEVLTDAPHIKTGGLGDGKGDSHILAQAFKTTVERTCGMIRLPEPSFKAAELLYNQGVTVEQVRDHTAAMVKDCLKRGRTPPITLDQVAQWAGLYKK